MKLLVHALIIASASIAVAQDCTKNPTGSSCADFKLSDQVINQDIDNLCSSMENMPGCSLRKACTKDGFSTQKYCAPMSILADLCTDMPSMSGCENNYVPMCSKDSVVKQCTEFPSLSFFSSTKNITENVASVCGRMYMDGCQLKYRSSDIDLYKVYSDLCLAMPEMHECNDWHNMCNKLGTNSFPYCVRGDDSPPQMRMYFHLGLSDYVLFQGWVPRSPLQYAATFIAIVVMGIMYEFLLTLRGHYEATWSPESVDTFSKYSRRQFCIDAARGGFQFFESTIAYLLMLVSMTFNVGLFFAVILGITLGTFCFARFRVYGTTKRPCGC